MLSLTYTYYILSGLTGPDTLNWLYSKYPNDWMRKKKLYCFYYIYFAQHLSLITHPVTTYHSPCHHHHHSPPTLTPPQERSLVSTLQPPAYSTSTVKVSRRCCCCRRRCCCRCCHGYRITIIITYSCKILKSSTFSTKSSYLP